jgi:glycerophosphoryl diester phosphodiesterase
VILLISAVLAFPAPWRYNAHNCYPEKGQHWERLDRARQAGLRAVEIDVAWSEEQRRTVISHEKEPSGGEPSLEQYFWKPLGPALRKLPRGRPEWLLLIDFKTDDLRVVEQVYRELEQRQALLSRFGKAIEYGPLTVLLTGDRGAVAAFERRNRGNGPYLAMGDEEPPGREYRESIADYLPAAATAFYRVFNFDWKHVEPDREARKQGPLPKAALARLKTLVDLAHQRGYWLRAWTLNGPTFGGREGLLERWRAAREAGVEMVATDEYELAGTFRLER